MKIKKHSLTAKRIETIIDKARNNWLVRYQLPAPRPTQARSMESSRGRK